MDFELLEPVVQKYFPVLQFVQGSFLEKGLNLHMSNFDDSQKTGLPSGKMWYMTTHKMREGNLMIPPIS